MMEYMTADELLAALKEPFAAKEVHWRVGNTNAKKLGCKPWEATEGSALAYINSRDVMKRLDSLVGMNGWQTHYPFAGCCALTIMIDGEPITKTNGAGLTDVEGEKGQYSDAFKRAATMFGVGRYLYYLPFQWLKLTQDRNAPFYPFASQPQLPQWALPKEVKNDAA